MENVDLLQLTKRLLRLYDLFPKKRLGQNFTVNTKILHKLISYASLNKEDIVLEVGPGFGFLTQLLSEKCKKVIAVELDPVLVTFLRKKFISPKNVELIEGDILDISLPFFNKVVSAPPYSISSPLLFHLLETKFDTAILILQKEFAERLAASVGTKSYGRLTVTLNYRAGVELLDYIPRTLFFPPPDVDSRIIRLNPRSPPFQVQDETLFFEIIRTLFTQRNKKVRNAIIPFLRKFKFSRKDALKIADSILYNAKRVRELAPEDFGLLSNEFLRILEHH